MKTNLCWVFTLIAFVAVLPILMLYKEIGGKVIVIAVHQFSPNDASWNVAKRCSHALFVSTCRPGISSRLIRIWQPFCKTHEQLSSLYPVKLTLAHQYTGNDSRCMHLPNNKPLYPICEEKLQWMRNGWKTHSCYAAFGVDGSICSFRRYLSLVENHCPPMDTESVQTTKSFEVEYAKTNSDLRKLFSVLNGKITNAYMKTRLEQNWSSWTESLRITIAKYPKTMSNRRKLNIIMHMGLLAEENLQIGVKSSSGGPLGELLQWSDLIACLFLLGHTLYISSDKSTLQKHVDHFDKGPCPIEDNRHRIDLIITDIVGLRSLKMRGDFLSKHECRLRLLDSFGTHAEFNHKEYFNSHRTELSFKGTWGQNPWGGHGLQLLQYWTFFPHTSDNAFLGFAIHRSDVKPLFERGSHGKPASLVYGKEKYMWSESKDVIDVLKNLTEVHATVADAIGAESDIFSGIINHGFLNSTGVASLLKSVNIFVGLGFPYEGPAPLEAVANGAVFINPKFDPPRSRLNTAFFRDKPTLRELTSQSPYMERLGKPYVYTVDVNNAAALNDAINSALNKKPNPFIPEEFTPHGMLIRVNALVSRDLCSKMTVWPPDTAFQPKLGARGESCEKTCDSAGLVCELSFFPLVNSAASLRRFFGCERSAISSSATPQAPYNCTQQSSSHLFSCASRPSSSDLVRICPCRDYLPGQIALCKQCTD